MGKSGKERKRRRQQLQLENESLQPLNEVPIKEKGVPSVGALLDGATSRGDVAACCRVLTLLANNPDDFQGPEFKQLRGCLHTLRRSEAAAVLGFGKKEVSRTQVVSDALRDERWIDALTVLAEMRQVCSVPRLGAVCRWVRDLDATDLTQEMPMKVLDSVLRTADPQQIGSMQTPAAIAALDAVDDKEAMNGVLRNAHIRAHPPWHAFPRIPSITEVPSDGEKEIWRTKFRPCLEESGENRQPPNKFDLTIHTSEPNAVGLDQSYHGARVVPVPFIPGSRMIADLFTAEECANIIKAGESVGFDPDQPVGGSAVGKKSILAHAFVWLVDEKFENILWERVKEHLPATLKGGRVVGMNRRWRCYRYVPGAVYRPHIDGAWPGSGLDSEGKYVYDAYGDRWSRLTFLIYLNDDFDGGWTTYYTPSNDEGVLDMRGVSPRKGACMVFPHGDYLGALLHEGSGVIKGAKYVVRTEVLYTKDE